MQQIQENLPNSGKSAGSNKNLSNISITCNLPKEKFYYDDFETRSKAGAEFEEKVYSYLRGKFGDCVMRTGFEFTRTGSRKTPDFKIIYPDNTFYFEVKSSNKVERGCFEYYLKLDKVIPVWLLILNSGLFYTIRVSQLQFVDSLEYVSNYVEPHEVDGDGWICPPTSSAGSGKPYRLIDLKNCEVVKI